ncbi:cysteine proteinase, partial [Artomyces pyxidatus]
DLATLTPAQLYELNQNAFDDSTASDRPLIASVAPLDVLRAEYVQGSQAFIRQIDFLQSQGFQGIRRTRGDGDCFYRSLAFAYIERILTSSDQSLAVMTSISTLEATLPMLDAAGFQKMVYEDFYETLMALIRRIGDPDVHGKYLTPEVLLEAFQDPEVSNYVVVFLRLLTSAQIRADPDSYEPFLFHPELGVQLTVRDFCEGFVEAVGREADHVQVTALSRAMKINVSIAYLDGRSSDGRVDFVEFHNAVDEGSEPLVLLYRPGHYDVLDKGSIEALSL